MRGVIIPALLVFIAVTWWAGRDASDASTGAASVDSASTSPSSLQSTQSAWPGAGADNHDVSTDTTHVEAGAQGTEDEAFRTYVDGKYRFLEPSEKPRAALLARERLAVAINTAKQSNDPAAKEGITKQLAELTVLDRKAGALLRPGDLATFEVLKDSDIEQFQLDDYAGGVNAVAPLNEAERKAILYTKLVHRQRFRQVLADSRLMSGELSTGERQIVFADVSRSLRESRDSYLQEVRQYLYNDEQFTLLSNYENTEFAAELEKLRGIANGE
jgi:hypothetical protein